MGLIPVIVTLGLMGLLCFGVSKANFITPPWKTVIYWTVGVCTAVWLLSITGVLDYVGNVKMVHV